MRFFGRHTVEKKEIVYRIGGVDSGEGVPAAELASLIYEFSDLIEASLRAIGADGKLEVNVRPFRNGSFITEFVLDYGQQAVSLLNGDEAQALSVILTALGFMGIGGKALPDAVRAVKGRITRHRDNGDGTFSYGDVTVDGRTHEIIQSEKVASKYRKIAIGPIERISSSAEVSVQTGADYRRRIAPSSLFTEDDVEAFSDYEDIAANGEEEYDEENVSVNHGIMLSPISGSYDADDHGYKFRAGDIICRNVSIDDEEFRRRMENGEIRFFSKDVLIADLEITQMYPKKNPGRSKTSYRILKVRDYRKYEEPEQIGIDMQEL